MSAIQTAGIGPWLDAAAHFKPEYREGLSNHLPMALIALRELGADDGALDRFARQYATRLESEDDRPREPVTDARHADSGGELGQPSHYARFRDAFDRALRADGLAATLHSALPRLAPGIGAAAFHGLIRTAYGVYAGHDGEVARGLAYWSARYLALTQALPEKGGADLQDWLGRFVQPISNWQPGDGLIHEDLRSIAGAPEFQARLTGLDVDALSIGELIRFAARRYIETRSFTVLHMLTSAHAVELVLPALDDRQSFLHWYALAFAGALATSSVRAPRPRAGADLLEWSEIKMRAIASSDDHLIKLVYTSAQLAVRHGDELLREVATTILE